MAASKEVIYPTNPADVKVISDAIIENVGSLTRQLSESDFRKETAKKIKEEYGIPPAIFNKLTKLAYDSELKSSADELHDIITEGYDLLVLGNKRSGHTNGITQSQIDEREKQKKLQEQEEKLFEAKIQAERESDLSIKPRVVEKISFGEDDEDLTEAFTNL